MKWKCFFFFACLLIFFVAKSLGQGFTDVSSLLGSFEHDGLPQSEDMEFGTGAAWFDYNQDGLLDLYITNRKTANKLFRNNGLSNGNYSFTDVAVSMGVSDPNGDGAGVVIGDINNDGYPDIFLANGNEDKLYRNNNSSSFTDITTTSGLDATADSRGTSGSFGDYDKDGFIDLYIAHHEPIPGASPDATMSDFIFYNNGNETFTNVSSLIDSLHLADAAFIGGWTDFDHDNDLDIIVITDCFFGNGPNWGTRVFRNDGGNNPINDWTFTEVRQTVLTDCSNGMGLGIGDYDRDGWMDLIYTDIGPVQLFRNNQGIFKDVTASTKVDQQIGWHYSWGTSFLDYNNDGWQDIIIALGDFGSIPNEIDRPNNLFENLGNGTFKDEAVTLGVAEPSLTRTIVHGDYDNDGDLDLLMVNYDTIVTLYRNDIVNSNNYIRIFLEGNISCKDALGAKVKITTPDGVIQYFEMKSGTNLGGGDEICAHFGLGSNTIVSEVEVTWLTGAVTILNDLSANIQTEIVEPLILPVELTNFSATSNDKTIRLDWNTSSETNNDFFEIQRSSNGLNFEKIGIIDGAGNSLDANNYIFLDKGPIEGINYYRLKQQDFEGSYIYTQIISSTFNSRRNQIKIYPNPITGNTIFVQFSEGYDSPGLFELFDMTGRMVHQKDFNYLHENNLTLEISIDNLLDGVYILRITDSIGAHTKKVLVNR